MHRVRVITNHLIETDTASVDIERNPTSEVDIEQIKLKYPSPSSEYLSFDELLSPRDQQIRYTVRQFAQQEIAPIINDFYERAEFPQAVVSKFGKLKLIGLDIKGYGCPEMTAVQNGLMALELARVSVGLATFCGILNNISMLAIYKCGSEEQKQKYLPKLASLELIGCFGLTEPNAGSDASNLQMTARPHVNAQGQSGWLLNGEKRWIGNGTHADVSVIWAKNSSTNQVNGFIVERGAPGLTTAKIENKVAMREVQNAHMTFKDVFVPDTQRLPKAENFATGPNQCLFLTRVIAGWIAVGCAMGAYDTCLQYVKQRTQFGAPLASFQIIQDRLVRMLGTINSLLLLMWRVSRLYDTHYDTCQSKTRATDPISIGKVSLAKSHCTSRAREVLQMAREVMGGNGLVTDYHVGKQFVDLEAVHTFEGSYDVNTLITAREVTGQSAFKK